MGVMMGANIGWLTVDVNIRIGLNIGIIGDC